MKRNLKSRLNACFFCFIFFALFYNKLFVVKTRVQCRTLRFIIWQWDREGRDARVNTAYPTALNGIL